MTENKTCGNCLFLVKEEGTTYYCAVHDLFDIRFEDDKACEDWKDGGAESLKKARWYLDRLIGMQEIKEMEQHNV